MRKTQCSRCENEAAAGQRYCKECKREYNKEYYRLRKEKARLLNLTIKGKKKKSRRERKQN